MAPDERRDEDEQPRLRVTDRRRFTDTGEAREEGSEAPDGPDVDPEPPAGTASAGDSPPAAGKGSAPGTDPGAKASEPAGREAPGVPPPESGELGIATVFLAFWQGALMNLGAQDPSGQSLPVNLEAARESIELLRVLRAKTAGNLTEEEDGMLRHLLHEAQMAYVQVAGGGGADGEDAP